MFRLSFLRIATALMGIVFFIFITACSKEQDITPAGPTHGLLVGAVTPVGATATITATGSDGRVFTAVPSATTGAYFINDLAPGVYQVSAVAAVGYKAPTTVSATVKAGTSTLANVEITRDYQIRGTMTWEQNGTSYTATAFYGDVRANILALEGSTNATGTGEVHTTNFTLAFAGPGNVMPFTGVGTYPLGTGTHPEGSYRYRTTNGIFNTYYTSFQAKPAGQVVVTQFDFNARRAAGTFAFVAKLASNGTGTAAATETITNGHFDITF